eukprot:5152909-Prymnesium_polylepis.2
MSSGMNITISFEYPAAVCPPKTISFCRRPSSWPKGLLSVQTTAVWPLTALPMPSEPTWAQLAVLFTANLVCWLGAP